MSFVISKTFEFSAGHRLQDLPPDHQCFRQHGHNYKVTLVLEAPTLNAYGMVRDYGELAPFKKMIEAEFEHRQLNDVLATRMPTAELLALHFYAYAHSLWPEVVACRVKETDKTAATYAPSDPYADYTAVPLIRIVPSD